MIVVDPGFLEPPLEAHGEVVGGVRGKLLSEQVHRGAEVEVQVLLDGGQVDDPVAAHVFAVVLVHHLAGALHHPPHAGLADEHVVGLLGQHEPAGARQRIEAGLGQRGELVLAVPVGEVGEHEERQPVGGLLVEGVQDARLVRIAGMALQHGLGLLAAVAAEIGVQQVDHGPQVPAFLHVHLEQVAQVVERRAGLAQVALLLHRGRLGVALGDDQAAQLGAVLAGHLLPGGLALVHAEVDAPVRLRRGEEDAPAVIRHAHVAVVGPAAGLDADRGAQVDVQGFALHGAQLVPPPLIAGLPPFQRPLQAPVLAQVDVVGDLLLIVDAHAVVPACSRPPPVTGLRRVSCRSVPAGPCRSA